MIVPIPLIADTNGNEFTGWGQIRRAQFETLNELSFLHECPAMYDLEFDDDLHLTQAGYEAMAERLVDRLAAIKGKRDEIGTLGPKAISATFNPTNQTYDVTIAHYAGTDFTLSEKRGHNPEVNNTLQGSNTANRVDQNTYRISVNAGTFSTSDTVKAMFPWGTLKGYNRSNILIDNAATPLPLRPFFGLQATEV